MSKKQPLKQGEKILAGIIGLFVVAAVIGYVVLESVRLNSDKPMFVSRVNYNFSKSGLEGSKIFRESRCSACHRVMGSGTSMGLSLDGVGSKHNEDWLYDFLSNPEDVYRRDKKTVTVDHGVGKEAGYVANMTKKQRQLIALYLSELQVDRGASTAPMPPEGRSKFIDSMVDQWAPTDWKDKYTDVRENSDDTDKGVE